MTRTVRGQRATKLARMARQRAQYRSTARQVRWLARIMVVCALIGVAVLATALTYRNPAPPSVATMRTDAPGYHGPYCAYVHATGRVASQAVSLLRPWL